MSARPAAVSATADPAPSRLFHAGQGMHLPRAAVLAFAAVDSPAGRTLVTDAARDDRLWNFAYWGTPRSVLLFHDGSVALVGATRDELKQRLHTTPEGETA